MRRAIRSHLVIPASLLLLAAGVGPLRSEVITVPNYSFESPLTGPIGGNISISVNVDSWQKTSRPGWYEEAGGFLWENLIGIFKNTPVGSSDRLDNCNLNHAIWLFAVPEVCLFQDYDSVDYNDPTPTHAFNATFEAGKSYALIVGINGGGGGMLPDASMEMSLYYRDGAGNRQPVAAKTVVHSLANFPTHTHFTDFVAQSPVVRPGDPWEDKHIGIQFLSTVPRVPEDDPNDLQGGYWDLDNVRIIAVPAPDVQSTPAGSNARVAWASAVGYRYQLKVSANFATWADYGAPLPGTGGELFVLYPRAGQQRGIFRVVVTPEP